MKNFLFFASIESDLLILSSISSLIKEIFPESETILLLPHFKRIYDKKNDYSVFFDKIIDVPQLNFSKNPVVLINNFIRIKKLFFILKPYSEGIFFLFDIYNLNELAVYAFIQKNKNSKMVTVTAFEGDEIDFSNLKIVIKGTLIKSFYSLLLVKKLFFEFKVKNSSNTGINYFRAKTHLQLCIKKSKFRNIFGKCYNNLPYPPSFLNTDKYMIFNKNKIIEPNSIIVFFETQISHWADNYWKSLNDLIDSLYQKEVNIYIKDHPNCNETHIEKILNRDVKVLPKEISAEILFLANRGNILAVFAHGSTALITASWLKIPSYDVSECFGFNKAIQLKLAQFLNLGDNIYMISNLKQIEKLVFNIPSLVDDEKRNSKDIWEKILIEELGI